MKRNPLIVVGFVLLAVVAIAAIVLLARNLNKSKVTGFQPSVIHEGKDSTVTITGANFPDPDKLEVTFNGIPAIIQSASKNTLVVLAEIQKAKAERFEDPLRFNFYVKTGQDYLLNDVLICELDKEPGVTDFAPRNFIDRPAVVFSGKNLNSPGLVVMINDQLCAQESVAPNQLIVRAPDLPDNLTGIRVQVFSGPTTVYEATGSTLRLTIHADQIIHANQIPLHIGQ